jgi:LysR family glycine cleavage system transcriptional activator
MRHPARRQETDEMRKLPPLNAVRAFEAAARRVSFTRAAEELHVTHGAVSRQVALLEDWFGVQLFRRAPSQITLTEPGERFYREAAAVLDRLALAAMDVKQASTGATLGVNAPPTFVMRWLIGRIAAFQRRRPDVELRLTTSIAPVGPGETGFEVAIRGGDPNIHGWTAAPFMTEFIAPVAHADVAARLKRPEDLRGATLVTYLTEPYDWPRWCAQAGCELASDQETLRFEQMFFALQAVQERIGVGLFPLFLVIDQLAEGSMRLPFGPLGLQARRYNAMVRDDRRTDGGARDFCAWLAEVGRETDERTVAWAKAQGWRLAPLRPAQS